MAEGLFGFREAFDVEGGDAEFARCGDIERAVVEEESFVGLDIKGYEDVEESILVGLDFAGEVRSEMVIEHGGETASPEQLGPLQNVGVAEGGAKIVPRAALDEFGCTWKRALAPGAKFIQKLLGGNGQT